MSRFSTYGYEKCMGALVGSRYCRALLQMFDYHLRWNYLIASHAFPIHHNAYTQLQYQYFGSMLFTATKSSSPHGSASAESEDQCQSF